MVKKDHVRVGGYGNMEVSYKILQLVVLNEALILDIVPRFQEGFF
jgi:hypothetical protein